MEIDNQKKPPTAKNTKKIENHCTERIISFAELK